MGEVACTGRGRFPERVSYKEGGCRVRGRWCAEGFPDNGAGRGWAAEQIRAPCLTWFSRQAAQLGGAAPQFAHAQSAH